MNICINCKIFVIKYCSNLLLNFVLIVESRISLKIGRQSELRCNSRKRIQKFIRNFYNKLLMYHIIREYIYF